MTCIYTILSLTILAGLTTASGYGGSGEGGATLLAPTAPLLATTAGKTLTATALPLAAGPLGYATAAGPAGALLSAGPLGAFGLAAAAPAAIGLVAAPAPAALAAVPAAGPAVPAAVLSRHAVNFYDVPSTGFVQPTTIDVPANILPINFVFRSASSMINVAQAHEGSKGSFKETASEDEPHRLVHTVTKPIIQEVREIISPYRRIVQTVEPVQEEIKTLVARGVSKGLAGAAAPALLAAEPAPIGLLAAGGGAGKTLGKASSYTLGNAFGLSGNAKLAY